MRQTIEKNRKALTGGFFGLLLCCCILMIVSSDVADWLNQTADNLRELQQDLER